MSIKKGTEYGTILIDPNVIAQMAGTIAVECFGIVGMASVNMREGMVRLVSKNRITNGIKVTLSDERKITIDFHVIVAYGVNIATVCQNLIESVRFRVEELCDLRIEKIHVFVEGVQNID